MRIVTAFVLAFGLSAVAHAGPQQLDRATASSFIKGSPAFSQPVTISLALGGTAYAGADLTLEKKAQAMGYVTVRSVQWGKGYYSFIVSPTAKLLDAITRNEWYLASPKGGADTFGQRIPDPLPQSLTIPVGKKELLSITGIMKDGPKATAEYKSQIVYNDVGKAFGLSGTPTTGSQEFVLYDDGWRLAPSPGGEGASLKWPLRSETSALEYLRRFVAAGSVGIDAGGSPGGGPQPTGAGLPAVQPVSLSIDKAVLADGIQNGDPVGVRDRFPSGARSLVCYLEVRGERAGQVVEFVWMAPDGQERGRSSSVLKAPRRGDAQFLFGKLTPRTILQPGDWRVDIYVDGALAKYISFSVY